MSIFKGFEAVLYPSILSRFRSIAYRVWSCNSPNRCKVFLPSNSRFNRNEAREDTRISLTNICAGIISKYGMLFPLLDTSQRNLPTFRFPRAIKQLDPVENSSKARPSPSLLSEAGARCPICEYGGCDWLLSLLPAGKTGHLWLHQSVGRPRLC